MRHHPCPWADSEGLEIRCSFGIECLKESVFFFFFRGEPKRFYSLRKGGCSPGVTAVLEAVCEQLQHLTAEKSGGY